MAILLYLSAVEARLVWQSERSFAVLEAPRYVSPVRRDGGLVIRFLRVLDRRWDLLIFAVPPALLLAVTAAVALGATAAGATPPLAIVWLAVAAMAYVTAFMLAQVATQVAWVRRVFGHEGVAADRVAEESLPGWNWSMPLCHHETDQPGRVLLDLVTHQMERLIRAHATQLLAAQGAEPEGVRVREVLICLNHGVTTTGMRRTLEAALTLPYGPGARVAFRMPTGPVEGYREPVQAGGGFFFTYLAGVLVVVPICAYLVATWEAQACAADCAGRPADWGSALRWLAWRLMFQDAPGLVPKTAQTWIIGWLTSLVGLMTLPVAWVSARLAIAANKRGVVDLVTIQSRALQKTRVLLMTVTATERTAVLDVFRPATGEVPERIFAENAVIYELGSIRNARVAMAQCARPGPGGPGGAILTTAEVIRRWRPDVVIMVGICYGLREDWKEPQRMGDVLVASTVHDLDRAIVFEGRVEPMGDRVSTSTALVARLSAASTDWPVASVHFGPMLASSALISSATRREELRREHSRAIGGDMEGHGLYAAAADAGVPWILAKAISDWGMDRDERYEPALAAANAAGFVLHTLTVGAFDQGIQTP
ncbi:5'-methylthioadenosine/S-adenosylhomocysteine nucleosidase family protein [Phytohabitans sp. LJ34]|uniref:5'-methylthioadenosine/S-adenosylhomocysteine nucleosidase family protein n=1 Tax=Phytohabitans sp. LJ34 TaxID=3452217 RepID=UPI003F88DCB8